MTDVMMQIGGLQFRVDAATYQRFRRKASYVWKEQDVVGDAAPLQAIRKAAETISLDGVIYTSYDRGSGPVGIYQVEAMRKVADPMQPLVLTDGMGSVYGLWVIEDIDEGQTEFWSNGAPRKQTFSISLKKYPEPSFNIIGLLTDVLTSWL